MNPHAEAEINVRLVTSPRSNMITMQVSSRSKEESKTRKFEVNFPDIDNNQELDAITNGSHLFFLPVKEPENFNSPIGVDLHSIVRRHGGLLYEADTSIRDLLRAILMSK